MSLDPKLTKFNAVAFRNLHIDALKTQITAYQTLTRRIDRLANLALAILGILAVKLVWNKISGPGFKIGVFSTSSIILGLFDLAVGGGALWCWIEKNNKTKKIAKEISGLARLTRRNFYGETTERMKDPVTKQEVLDSMQENLNPLFKESVPIEKDYILITTYQFSLQGDSAETFKISSTRVADNFDEIKATIAVWRTYYSELYQADPASRKSVIMQVIASQCIQELPSITIVDGISQYSCLSPTILNPKNGIIWHNYKSDRGDTNLKTCSLPKDFKKHLAQLKEHLDSLPKVKILDVDSLRKVKKITPLSIL